MVLYVYEQSISRSSFMPLWWNWQTRTTQNRVSKDITVRLRSAAPRITLIKLLTTLYLTATINNATFG